MLDDLSIIIDNNINNKSILDDTQRLLRNIEAWINIGIKNKQIKSNN